METGQSLKTGGEESDCSSKATESIARLRGGVAGIYAQKKLNEFDEENDT